MEAAGHLNIKAPSYQYKDFPNKDGSMAVWFLQWKYHTGNTPDSKVHGANMGPVWVRQT